MLELIFTVVIYLAGAITEYESRGKVTEIIMYQDSNNTTVECHDYTK